MAEEEKPDAAKAKAGRLRRRQVLTGRVLTILVVLFLVFDAVVKLAEMAQVHQAFDRLGVPTAISPSIGLLLLCCTVLYAIPRTAVLGAVLLTGFLGGAVAIQYRAGSLMFECVFPVLLGILMWGGIYLRECRLGNVFPVRR